MTEEKRQQKGTVIGNKSHVLLHTYDGSGLSYPQSFIYIILRAGFSNLNFFLQYPFQYAVICYDDRLHLRGHVMLKDLKSEGVKSCKVRLDGRSFHNSSLRVI